MSILIKGMKMPENCSECPVALSGKYCRINKTYTTYIKLPFRPEHCQLVELPEEEESMDERKKLHLAIGKAVNKKVANILYTKFGLPASEIANAMDIPESVAWRLIETEEEE